MATVVELVPGIIPTSLPKDPWGQYLGAHWQMLGFEPPGIAKDVIDVVQNRNDPSAWLAFAATTLRTVWRELPPEIRDKLRNVIEEAISQASEAFEKLGTALDAIPIIGQILGALLETIRIYRRIAFEASQRKSEDSYRQKLRQQRAALLELPHPNQWVLAADVRSPNYLDYSGIADWRLRACFDVSTGDALTMFRATAGKAEAGHCGQGARRYTCPPSPTGADPTWNCSPYAGDQGKRKACERYASISALFYPFWLVGGVPGPIPPGYFTYDINEILISRQTALLTSPHANLRVSSDGVRKTATNFRSWWTEAVAKGLSRIDDQGRIVATPAGERILVDASQDPAHIPTTAQKRALYFDGAGLVQTYEGMQVDATRWGVAQPGSENAMSVATANAIVTSVGSFFAARASMIRNTRMMKALVTDTSPTLLDASVRKAVAYSADQFPKILQLPAPEQYGKPAFVIPAQRVGGEGGVGVALLGLGIIGLGTWGLMRALKMW